MLLAGPLWREHSQRRKGRGGSWKENALPILQNLDRLPDLRPEEENVGRCKYSSTEAGSRRIISEEFISQIVPPSPKMPRPPSPSIPEKEFLFSSLKESLRLDGRQPLEMRNPVLTFGPDLGWVECAMGKTRYAMPVLFVQIHMI